MIKEYALDPKLLDNWKDFRYFFEKFGIENGRLISRYPRNWTGKVKDAIKNCRDIEYLRIIECLENIDEKLCRRHHEWSKSGTWLSNAENEHAARPFHAIIAEDNPRDQSFVLVGDELDERNALWETATQADISRRASVMAEAVSVLLQQSRFIVLIDPHFDPQEARFRRPLKAFLEAAVINRTMQLEEVTYFLEQKSTYDYFQQQCYQNLPDNIPENIAVNFVRLCKKHGGEKLHDRFVITERGGIGFTVGLDDGNKGEHTNVYILSEKKYLKTWNDYVSESPAYEIIDKTVIAGR